MPVPDLSLALLPVLSSDCKLGDPTDPVEAKSSPSLGMFCSVQ